MEETKKVESQYEMINLLQGVNLFSHEDYISFYKKSLEAKSKVMGLMGGATRIYAKLENDTAINIENERRFNQEIKSRYKEEFGLDSGFFKLCNILSNSKDVVGNKHSSGKKITKVINQTPELGEKVVLLYSQVKNSFIIPDSYLVVSVEPYDFVMMGKGQGWHTCYQPMGEHYSGGYSLALDKFTFLTYIITQNPNKMGDTEIPLGKIYRRLAVFNKTYDGMMMSTQYPYKNSGMEEFTTNFLEQLFFSSLGEEIVYKHDKHIKTYKTSLSQIYNDFTLASSMKRENLYVGVDRKEDLLKYGNPFKCLHCGGHIALNDMPICSDCEYEIYGDDWSDIM